MNMTEPQIIQKEEVLIIETPERVELHFALASIGNRFLAAAFDHSLQFTILLLMFWAFSALTDVSSFDRAETIFSDTPKWILAVFIIVSFLIFTGYFVFFEWAWNGQTPGKRLLKLRVIREDGRPLTFWEAAARNVLRTFDIMPFPFYSFGLISVFLSPRDQRVGDFFAGTVVVRENQADAPTFEQVFSSPMSDSAYLRMQVPARFTADLSQLKEAEIEVVEAFLRRRQDLKDFSRQWMAWRVAMPILYKLKPDYDLQTFTYEGFLEELLHRYRSQNRYVN
ncbi:MAG: RDD family protein [Pyrinomonadaceae bacterium]|nr:RDD family protein [Pyrinomonadaceae bacterium]